MNWFGSSVLVTGATGIVGAWLVKDLLNRGARVAAIVRDDEPQSELVRSGDVLRISVVSGALEEYATVERAVSEHAADTVFHLGAQTQVGTALRSPLATFEANVRGTYNVLEACRVHRDLVKRLVFASSDKAYGEHPQLPYTEDAPLLATHPYDASKSVGETLARSYHATYGLPVTIARCGNIFGGGDLNWVRIVPGAIRAALRGEPLVIRSDGQFVRDYLYVKDAVAGYLALAERLDDPAVVGRPFNFSAETPMTVLEVAERIQKLVGGEPIEPIILDEARAEIHSQHVSAARARSVLGWSARFDFDAGLAETIEWYRAFLGEEGRR